MIYTLNSLKQTNPIFFNSSSFHGDTSYIITENSITVNFERDGKKGSVAYHIRKGGIIGNIITNLN